MQIQTETIIIAGIIWIVSIIHMYSRGKTAGFTIGNKTGVTNTLNMLEKYDILNIETYNKVISRMRDENES